MDASLVNSSQIIIKTRACDYPCPVVRSFFDESTFTVSYVVHDPVTLTAAIIDPVLNFDLSSGRTSTKSAEKIVVYVESEGLTVEWLLETHAHADHLTASRFLLNRLGGKLAIGRGIIEVQRMFGEIFNATSDFTRDGSQFDHLFGDDDAFEIGALKCRALHVPGHTPADMCYVVGDALFCGDTLFMPDYGTARADFPGGDARQLYHSIRRIFSLPDETRLFVCHDYKAPGREEFVWETTVGAERRTNVHARDGVSEDEFVAARSARDATLAAPKLIWPSVQFNMRAGEFPPAESNGTCYFKIPLNMT